MKSSRNLLPFESYFQFRVGDRHLESIVTNVVTLTSSYSGRPWSKMCVAIGIRSVCCWKPKLHRPAENRRFFHGGCPSFSTSLQVLERAIITRRTPKHPELDPVGICFDRVLNSHGLQKYSKKTWGGCTPPPPAVRGLRKSLYRPWSSAAIRNNEINNWM